MHLVVAAAVDRFVLQSEVLFPKGSADINPAGAEELDKLAA